MKTPKAAARRGSAMIIALCLIITLLIFGGAFLLLPWQEYVFNHRVYQGAVALNLAEAGVDYVYHEMNLDPQLASWSGSPKRKTVSDFATSSGEVKGDFVIEAWPTPMVPKPQYLVKSVGTTEMLMHDSALNIWKMIQISRTVKALCVPSVIRPFAGAFLGDNIVTLGGNITVDSYDSRDGAYGGDNVHRGAAGTEDEGKGDIATNSTGDPAVNLGNNITVYGDIKTGEGGTVVPVPDGFTGEITHDFSQELPYKIAPTNLSPAYVVQPGDGTLTVKKDTVEYPAGNYKFTRLNLTGGNLVFNGPSVVWVTGLKNVSISETGNGQITCNGKVEFYVDDEVSLAGNGIVNTSALPTDCFIYGSEGCDNIYCGGSNAFYGSVYAPGAEVKLAGSEDKYGAFVGKTIVVQGGSEFHYDEALGDVELEGGKYALRYWQEL